MTLNIFNSEEDNQRNKIGQTDIEYVKAAGILTKASGFMGTYDFTLNPYSGCSFGCNYCYAAFFTRSHKAKDDWGYWLKVKENALQLLRKKRKGALYGKTIYMSSVTDPYQPIEKELEITRSLLKELLHHQPRLVVQTRSPLIVRDVDLYKQFDVVQINMTVTTDSEEVRKAFEPLCPSNKVRLKAIKQITNAGINTCITMTPLLPIEDGLLFSKALKDTGVQKYVVQPFHPNKGKFVASTRDAALRQTEKMAWNESRYNEVVEMFKRELPWLGEGKQGFASI